jgi:2-polyprenyl-3-methyl-5-hydroxy-6-metoxy-1,4-benzoquinol methylase
MSAKIINKYCKDNLFNSLELGAGTGQLSKILYQIDKVMEINMVDSSASSIKYMIDSMTHEQIKNYNLFNISINNFANIHSDKKYDIVFSSGLIEHFKDNDLKTLCTIHKHLSSNYVVIIVPADNPENNAQAKTEKHKKKYGYEKPMNEKELDFLFIDNIFKHVYSERFYKNEKLLISIYQRINE